MPCPYQALLNRIKRVQIYVLFFGGGLKSGMSKAEVSQLYPKMQINITFECPAAIRGIYRAGRLTTVHLSLKGSRCQSMIIASMLEKYGPPDDSEVTDHQGLMRMLNSRNLIWIKNSVQIKLEAATTGLKADVFYSRYESSNVESGADRL